MQNTFGQNQNELNILQNKLYNNEEEIKNIKGLN